jgi:hypothetical protein
MKREGINKSLDSLLEFAAEKLAAVDGSVLVVERCNTQVRVTLHPSPALEVPCFSKTVNFDYFSMRLRRIMPSLPIVGKDTTMTARSLSDFHVSNTNAN